MLRSGKGVLEQVLNRLAEHKRFSLPSTAKDDVKDIARLVQLNGGDLELPANIVKRVEFKPNSAKAIFEGFTINTK